MIDRHERLRGEPITAWQAAEGQDDVRDGARCRQRKWESTGAEGVGVRGEEKHGYGRHKGKIARRRAIGSPALAF